MKLSIHLCFCLYVFTLTLAGCSRPDSLEKATRVEVKVPQQVRTVKWYQSHKRTEDAVVQTCGSNFIKYEETPDCLNARLALVRGDSEGTTAAHATSSAIFQRLQSSSTPTS